MFFYEPREISKEKKKKKRFIANLDSDIIIVGLEWYFNSEHSLEQ